MVRTQDWWSQQAEEKVANYALALKVSATGYTKGCKDVQTYHMLKEEILNVCEEPQ